MNSASDLLTSSETLTTNARSALGIDSATGSRHADLDATFEKYAVPGHVGAAPDLEAEARAHAAGHQIELQREIEIVISAPSHV